MGVQIHFWGKNWAWGFYSSTSLKGGDNWEIWRDIPWIQEGLWGSFGNHALNIPRHRHPPHSEINQGIQWYMYPKYPKNCYFQRDACFPNHVDEAKQDNHGITTQLVRTEMVPGDVVGDRARPTTSAGTFLFLPVSPISATGWWGCHQDHQVTNLPAEYPRWNAPHLKIHLTHDRVQFNSIVGQT